MLVRIQGSWVTRLLLIAMENNTITLVNSLAFILKTKYAATI